MATIFSSWDANISDDTTNSPPLDKYARTMSPNLVKLVQELFVFLDVSELASPIFVFF